MGELVGNVPALRDLGHALDKVLWGTPCVFTIFTDVFHFCSRVVRKSIARVLTVINQTQKENLRKFYKVSRGV